MPTFFHNDVYDLGLVQLTNNGNRFDICATQPTTYTEATSTYSLGYKTSISIGSPQNRSGGGRRVVLAQFSNGQVTAAGLAAYWAITDTVNSKLLAAGALQQSQEVYEGNTFNLAADLSLEMASPTS